ncbi:MAG: serine/threonine protein kinase [Gemmatimonadaceae bacterium]|nr:serine/threonine protein kinase [Gemmatimonadaceae bacterium]
MEEPTNNVADPTADALRRAVEGQFRLDREIGRGGMGIVYCAFDVQLAREVAIKTLPPHLAADAQVRTRFLREARTAAQLSHPNIVPIYSAAERDGVVYFSMGFVDGESLAERVARQGPLSPADLVPLLDQLAAALGFAHAHGVVHRDVKAENVLLDRKTGRAMVTDFGIARVAETQPLTATGTVLGTVHYMSPEQVTGDALDGRSDLYSLGVLAFFALTGRFPLERPTASAVVVAHVNSPPWRLHDVLLHCPPELDALVAKLLAKAPGDRYPDAEALRRALREMTSGPPPLPRKVEYTTPGATRGTDVVFSSTEAQQVWSRAAELQANTGMITPPPVFTPRSHEEQVTRGYDAAVVKASAIDAGIDEKYVARALVEKAHAQRVSLAEVTPGELMQKKPNFFLGARTKLEYTAAFEGELAGDDFEEIAEEVRRALGEMVTVSAVGRSLTINTTHAGGRQMGSVRALQLHLTSRNGRTQVRVYEDLGNTAGQWFAGLGIGLGTGVSAMVGGLAANATHSPPVVIGAVVLWIGTVYSTCRAIFGRTVRKRDTQLRDILRRVIARAEQILEEKAGPKRLERPLVQDGRRETGDGRHPV